MEEKCPTAGRSPMREAFTSGVVNYTQNLLTLIAVLIYMGFIDWQLTMVVLLGVPLVALAAAARCLATRIRKANRRAR